MKSVIYFLYEEAKENNLDVIQPHINHNVKQFVITNISNPHKTIYNKIENIFYYKDKVSCVNNLVHVLNYLLQFNYTEVLLLNAEKFYRPEQMIYRDLNVVKNEFSIINNIL